MPRYGRKLWRWRVRRPLCLKLPDGINFDKVSVRPNFPLGTFLWAFYLFRFYIFKEFVGAFKPLDKFLLGSPLRAMHCISQDLVKYIKNHYIGTILLFKSSEARTIKGNKFELIINDLRALRHLAIKEVNRRRFGKLFFYESKRALILFDEFLFRAPFLFYVAFHNLGNFLKAYKYNEYLNRTCHLEFYPLLRVVLRGASRMRYLKYRAYKKLNKVLLSTRFYYDNRIFLKESKGKRGLPMSNLALLYNGSLFLKLLRLNKVSFKFLYDYARLPYMNGFFFFAYEVWASVERKGREHTNPNALNSHKWRIYYILHLVWFLFDHDENFPKWACLLIGLKMCRVAARANLTNYNILGLRAIKRRRYTRLANIRLCVFGGVAVTFIIYYRWKYFKALRKIALRYPRRGLRGRIMRKLLDYVKRTLPTDCYRANIEYHNDNDLLMKKLSARVYNYDLIHWKIYYGGNFLFQASDFDYSRAIKKRKEDNIVNIEYEDFIFGLKSAYQGVEILTGKRVKGKGKKAKLTREEKYTPKFVSEYFFIQFFSDLFFKIMLVSFASVLVKHNYVWREQGSYMDWQFKLLLDQDRICKGYRVYWEYYERNREWFRVKMGRGTCFDMCINVVTYSFPSSPECEGSLSSGQDFVKEIGHAD